MHASDSSAPVPATPADAATAASPPHGVTPARLGFMPDGTPCAPDYGDVYHSAAGALAQAQHVFLGGNGLPQRWQGRERFVILETGFGLGNNFLATWAAWRADPQRCERLIYVALEKHPLLRADLARVQAGSKLPELAAQLLAQWPLPTPDLHPLDFEAGRVQLLLVHGDAARTLPGLQLAFDACYLDGFAPARNAELWSADIFRKLARLAAPQATAATWSAARAVRDGLAAQGFEVRQAPGFSGKRDMTVAQYAPRYTPPLPAALRPPQQGPRAALVIGAGLAGCAAAWALARQGWHCTVLDRQPGPAQETSGNAGGLMHGTFNAPDSLHARWFRAAAQLTARLAAPALASGALAGRLDGFLRLDARLDGTKAEAQLASVGLPADYLRWLDRDEAAARSGLDLPCGGWWYGQAGWLSPSGWAGWLLAQAEQAGLARFIGNATVARLQRADASAAAPWQAIDADGRLLASAPVVVLANALQAPALLPAGLSCPPLGAVRGQTSLLPGALPGLRQPQVPLSGQGYALGLPAGVADGGVLIGATSQHHDADPALRAADHAHNLQRAAALGLFEPGAAPPEAATLAGRVGWRAVRPDRLPLIGPPLDPMALAAAQAQGARLDALRLQQRQHDAWQGLYLLAGLGSRGITSAALAAQVAASWITGAPCPVDSTLRDAVDVARSDRKTRAAATDSTWIPSPRT